MSTLKKYNLDGGEVGEVSIEEQFLNTETNHQMIKDYLVALRANARQWSANTKGRSEVSHSTRKPHRQKGTGGARQGTLAAPQYKGGGIVFGPKPKFDQHIKINRKERRSAIRHLLAEKVKDHKLIVVEDAAFQATLKEPKTKRVASFLKKREFHGKRILFVGEGSYAEEECEGKVCQRSISDEQHEIFRKSMRNLPKCGFAIAANINGYDVASAHGIVVTESALMQIQNLLK